MAMEEATTGRAGDEVGEQTKYACPAPRRCRHRLADNVPVARCRFSREGAPLAKVDVPSLSEEEAAGKPACDANCASCHGAIAAGQDGVGPFLVHKIYDPGHLDEEAFFLAAGKGVRAHHWRFGNMPPVEDEDDQALADIVAYVRALERANGIN